MWSIVGLNSAFIASGFILSMPCEDHFTKSTLQKRDENTEREREREMETDINNRLSSLGLSAG